MVFLRATRKVLSRLPAPTPGQVAQDDTALGDWFVNRVVVGRKPLLVLISSNSLLPILLPAKNVRTLPVRLPALVSKRLARLGMADVLIRAEVSARDPVVVGPTNDRSVLGILTDFSGMLPVYARWEPPTEAGLIEIEGKLGNTPCFASRKLEDTVWPERKAAELMWRRWSSSAGLGAPE